MGNVIEWSEESPRGVGGKTRSGLIDHAAIAREVHSQPSRWAKIAEGLSDRQAYSLAHTISNGMNKTWAAEGRFDATSKQSKGRRTYEVWALYMGD